MLVLAILAGLAYLYLFRPWDPNYCRDCNVLPIPKPSSTPETSPKSANLNLPSYSGDAPNSPTLAPAITETAVPTESSIHETVRGSVRGTEVTLPAADLQKKAPGLIPPVADIPVAEPEKMPCQFKLEGDQTRLEALKKAITDYCVENNLGEKACLTIGFRDLTSGDFLGLDQDYHFVAASTIKVPSAMYSYDLAAEGLVDLDNTLLEVNREKIWEAGGGAVTAAKDGTVFSLRELLSEMIINSDNTAFQMVNNYWTGKCPDGWLVIGIDRRYGLKYQRSQGISALEGVNLMTTLYGSGEHYKDLLNDMLNSTRGGLGRTYLQVPVASKYGMFEKNLHDMGIVFSEHPFAYTVLTYDLPNAEEHIAHIVELLSHY